MMTGHCNICRCKTHLYVEEKNREPWLDDKMPTFFRSQIMCCNRVVEFLLIKHWEPNHHLHVASTIDTILPYAYVSKYIQSQREWDRETEPHSSNPTTTSLQQPHGHIERQEPVFEQPKRTALKCIFNSYNNITYLQIGSSTWRWPLVSAVKTP